MWVVKHQTKNQKSQKLLLLTETQPLNPNNTTQLPLEKKSKGIQEMKKINNANENEKEERTVVKMDPSSSTQIRLRGKLVQAYPEEKESMSLLQNKLLLTKPKKQYKGLQVKTTLKFHF